MLQRFQYIYNGQKLIRVNTSIDMIGRVEAVAGEIKEISVYAPNVGSTGNFVFNVRKNGTPLLSGGDRLTINTSNKRVEKTDADFDEITTAEGDLLSFVLDEIAQGGILGDIIFNIVIDDGVSTGGGAESLDELSDVILTAPANDDFIQRKSGNFVNRTVAQVKTDLLLTGTNSGDETTATIKTKLGIATLSGANTGDETAASIGSLISGATDKATPVNADSLAISDSAASGVLKKLSLTNLKAFLKTYFDSLYQAVLVSGTNLKTVNGNSLLGSGDLAISGGGGSVPQDFISGLNLVYVGNQAVTIKKGSAYVNGSVLTVAADIAKTGIATVADNWYYVYLYDNSGTPDVEISTTAPAFYFGEASQKTGNATRRFIGCFYARTTNTILRFTQTVNKNEATHFYNYSVDSLVMRIVGGASSAAIQTVNLTVVPDVVYKAALVSLNVLVAASGGDIAAGVSGDLDASATYPSLTAQLNLRFHNSATSAKFFFLPAGWVDLSARQVKWQNDNFSGSNQVYVDVRGFKIYR